MKPSYWFKSVLLSALVALLAACGGGGSAQAPVGFSINGAPGRIQGNQVTIDLSLAGSCSALTDLALVVEARGSQVLPEPSTVKDFSAPVTFVLTDEGGQQTAYVLTVVANPCAGSAQPAVAFATEPAVAQPTGPCQPEPAATSGYSLVFKGCDANNTATYHDKTECVRDNATGLIWEGKTTEGLRASSNRYNNLDNTGLLQVGERWAPFGGPIPASTPTQAEIGAVNNSVGFKSQVNASNLCGFSDWRLPTKDELLSIRTAGSTTLIDFVWFPNTDWNGAYATSTQFGGAQDRSWVVQFYEFGVNKIESLPREEAIFHPTLGPLFFQQHSVRLVR